MAGMLLPALGTARKRAYKSQCASNLKQNHAAGMLYSNDFNGLTLMHASCPAGGHGFTGNAASAAHMLTAMGYFGKNVKADSCTLLETALRNQMSKAVYCPVPVTVSDTNSQGNEIYFSPQSYRSTYTLSDVPIYPEHSCGNFKGVFWVGSRVLQPSTAAVLLDGARLVGTITSGYNSDFRYRFAHLRHLDRFNSVYLDGHVEGNSMRRYVLSPNCSNNDLTHYQMNYLLADQRTKVSMALIP